MEELLTADGEALQDTIFIDDHGPRNLKDLKLRKVVVKQPINKLRGKIDRARNTYLYNGS